MTPNASNLDRIKPSDLTSLVGSVREDRFIDFKEQTYPKELIAKELSKDVTAFANTSGGCILIGVKEAAGVASEVSGIELPDADQMFRHLQQVISSNTRPVPIVRFEKVEVAKNRFVVMVGVPASRNRPHMATAVWPGVFYRRTDGGTIEAMDVDMIRRAFVGSSSDEDDVLLRHNAMMNRFSPPAETVLVGVTLSPIPADEERVDIRSLEVFRAAGEIQPVYYRTFDYRPTFDGLLTHRPREGIFEQRVMRTGTICGVYGLDSYKQNETMIFRGAYVLKELAGLLRSAFGFYSKVHIAPPMLLAISLRGCRGQQLDSSGWGGGERIEIDDLVFPPIAVDDATISPYQYLADTMHRLWQAGGMTACPFFDKVTNQFNQSALTRVIGCDV